MIRHCHALLMLALSMGCASTPAASHNDSDASSDVRDVLDAADASDASDVLDASNARDVPDASDVLDSSDAPDVLDAADVLDASDAYDAADVRCATDLTRCGETCVDLASNASHCGACGRVCDIPHATARCEASVCRLATCDDGFADCNGDPADGCEVDLLTDRAHCGTCATSCTFAHAAATCEGGACVMGACEAPFADCDGRADDGCEVDTARDAANCGACALQCSLDGARSAVCAAGACAIGACATGRADCDGTASNGCEVTLDNDRANCGACGRACAAGETCAGASCVRTCAATQTRCGSDCFDLANDPRNCGACGRVCTAANGVAGCAAGRCTVASCNAGRADCDGNATNGCEVDLTRTLSHCGACGRVCAVANGAAACTAGRCEIAVCNPGRGDCNRAPADGCEVDFTTNASHCGACGNRCGAGLVCRNARCECDTPRGSPGTFSRTVRAGGEVRRYRVFVPSGYNRAVATPTLLVYHGFSMSPDEMASDTQLDAEGARRNTIVVYPEGRYTSWNASICCPLATTLSIDDVAFFDAMVRDLSATFCVDPRRLGLAGYSNGGMMAQRIACQRASTVSSVSAVSGPYDGSCAPSRPVPIFYTHAVDDTRVPYNGGTTSGLAGAFLPSVSETLRRWRGVDRCGTATTTWLTAGDTTCYRYNGCAAEVSHCRVGSGGHRWPRPPQSLTVSPRVMDFFLAHPLP